MKAQRASKLAMQNRQSWASMLVGHTVGDYRIEEFLGQGGFGIVMKALDTKSGKVVAMKVLSPEASLDSQFEFKNEANLLSRLVRSSNVVTLMKSDQFSFPIGTKDGTSVAVSMNYHILELAHGCLEELVLNRNELDWVERLRLWRGVVLGVHQMHLHEIVHRDLKSENCLLFVRPKNLTDCKVTDLGRSRHLPSPAMHTPEQYIVGRGDTRFSPPEYLAWQGDDTKVGSVCADLYGLGAVLFELGTGQPITAFSLGDGEEVKRKNLLLLQAGKKVELSGLRSSYEPAFRLFELSVPIPIRQSVVLLMRQLCDPVPNARLPKRRLSQKGIDLELLWLLTRIDILIGTLAADSRTKLKNSKKFATKSRVSINGGA